MLQRVRREDSVAFQGIREHARPLSISGQSGVNLQNALRFPFLGVGVALRKVNSRPPGNPCLFGLKWEDERPKKIKK